VSACVPGEAGKQLFKEYPLSDQPVVARAYGRKGGNAGKGKAKTGRRAKGVPNTGMTGGVGQGGAKHGGVGQGDAKHGEGGQARGQPTGGPAS
jgi:hypothetical protein